MGHNLVFTVPADVRAPGGARKSAGTILTVELNVILGIFAYW